ncbi:MAG TPA: hypothetical protein VGX23_01690 [Actinocrinis sp.]|nr:hypothetical protein [Actinocrinis sp.]
MVFLDAAGRDPGDVVQDIFEACYGSPGYVPDAIIRRMLLQVARLTVVVDGLACGAGKLGAFLEAVPASVAVVGVERAQSVGAGCSVALGEPVEWPLAGASAECALDVVPGAGARERWVVALLALAGAGGVDADLFALSSGVIDGGGGALEVLDGLISLAIVEESELGYRVVSDLRGVEDCELGVEELERVGQALTGWAADLDVDPVRVAAHAGLIVGVVGALVAADRAEAGVRLARAAAPGVACSLRLGAWRRVLDQGAAAAKAAGDALAEAYFRHETGVRFLAGGSPVAAAAVLASAVELWGELGRDELADRARAVRVIAVEAAAKAGPTAGPLVTAGGDGRGGGRGAAGGSAAVLVGGSGRKQPRSVMVVGAAVTVAAASVIGAVATRASTPAAAGAGAMTRPVVMAGVVPVGLPIKACPAVAGVVPAPVVPVVGMPSGVSLPVLAGLFSAPVRFGAGDPRGGTPFDLVGPLADRCVTALDIMDEQETAFEVVSPVDGLDDVDLQVITGAEDVKAHAGCVALLVSAAGGSRCADGDVPQEGEAIDTGMVGASAAVGYFPESAASSVVSLRVVEDGSEGGEPFYGEYICTLTAKSESLCENGMAYFLYEYAEVNGRPAQGLPAADAAVERFVGSVSGYGGADASR